MSLRRLDEFAFVYEKVASYANFRASFSSVLIMAEESSQSQDLNNENELYLIDTDDES